MTLCRLVHPHATDNRCECSPVGCVNMTADENERAAELLEAQRVSPACTCDTDSDEYCPALRFEVTEAGRLALLESEDAAMNDPKLKDVAKDAAQSVASAYVKKALRWVLRKLGKR